MAAPHFFFFPTLLKIYFPIDDHWVVLSFLFCFGCYRYTHSYMSLCIDNMLSLLLGKYLRVDGYAICQMYA